MRKDEADEEIRRAGTNALLNALEFVKTNFDNEVERNFIMQTVCETCTAESKELKSAAFECTVRVVELYYDKLAPYMQALYTLTLQAIEKATHDPAEDEVGQQAIEFWSTICDEELELIEEAHEVEQRGRRAPLRRVPPSRPFTGPPDRRSKSSRRAPPRGRARTSCAARPPS